MKKITINLWEINGYKSNYDEPDPGEYNTHFTVAFDNRFTKKDVEDIFYFYYRKKYTFLSFEALLLQQNKII